MTAYSYELRQTPHRKRAVRRGTLVPEPCLFCGAETTQAHHHDYSQPLAVTWLCVLHHRLAHRSELVCA